VTLATRIACETPSAPRAGHDRRVSAPHPVVELVGVYDADGTIRGELSYLVRRAAGRGHCALCDISHGTLRRRPSFDIAIGRLPVPLRMLHRDELDADQAAAAADSVPCVLAVSARGVEVLLDRAALERRPMDAEELVDLILDALSSAGS
jgi:hypothetical protein